MFINLRCYTEYSFGQSLVRVDELFAKAAKCEMEAVGITDVNNMHALLEMRWEQRWKAVRPVVGCEVRVLASGAGHGPAPSFDNLALLVKDAAGYRNLCLIVSEAQARSTKGEGLDFNYVAGHAKGLVALSGGPRSELGWCAERRDEDALFALAMRYSRCFGEDLFLEVRGDGFEGEAVRNDMLLKVAAEHDIPLVATAECRYLSRSHAGAYEALRCRGEGETDTAAALPGVPTQGMHFKTEEEMRELFPLEADAIANTVEIARLCRFVPGFKECSVPAASPGEDACEVLGAKAARGLERRLDDMLEPVETKPYWKRLHEELEAVRETSCADTILLVADIVKWMRTGKIPFSPGYGKTGGSILCWALRISDVDPVAFDLHFEWFLRPGKDFWPSVGLQVAASRLPDVLEYLRGRHGSEHVARMTRFERLRPEDAVQAVCLSAGIDPLDCRDVVEAVPEGYRGVRHRFEAREIFSELCGSGRDAQGLLESMHLVSGLPLGKGAHDEGAIVSARPLSEQFPLWRDGKGAVVHFGRHRAWPLSRVWFDMVPCPVAQRMARVMDIVDREYWEPVDWDEVALDDGPAFALFANGETSGIPEFDAPAMRTHLVRLRPKSVFELACAYALTRPGHVQSGTLEEYMRSKESGPSQAWKDERWRESFADTHGVPVFHEQLGEAAMRWAGYSLPEAVLLRRVLARMVSGEIAAQRRVFLEGAREGGLPERSADHLFEVLERFSVSLYPKTHAVSVAMLAFRCAYLKAHYYLEFMDEHDADGTWP